MGDRKAKILVAGLGNFLLRDAGIGVQAVRELQKNPPEGVRVVEVGTAVVDDLHLFAWADRILAIDAVKGGGSAGTIYALPLSGGENDGSKASLHGFTLLAALQLLPSRKRPSILILGVEPEFLHHGIELSDKVAAVLPVLIRSAREIVDYWRLTPHPIPPPTIDYVDKTTVFERWLKKFSWLTPDSKPP